MCLAVPAEIIQIHETYGVVSILGLIQKINIQLIDGLGPGDYVLVHAGFAIQKIDTKYFDFLEQTLQEMLIEKEGESNG